MIANEPVASPSREQWQSKSEYLLSVLGMAIGLGNVWRFPYLCFVNGGGAFLVPYVVMLAFVGIPMFLLETSMAQFASTSVLNVFDICPAMRGIGFAEILATAIATVYYSVLVAYPLVFIYESFTLNWETWHFEPLPWTHCSNSFNTINCVEMDPMSQERLMNESRDMPTETWLLQTASEQFYNQKVLEKGAYDDLSLVAGVSVANVLVWVVCFLVIFKGIKVLGKVMWVTAIFPFLMLFILMVRSVTLPGAMLGLRYYLYPEGYKLLDIKVWMAAASQIFFSLGLGWGSLYCLGSFNRFNNVTVRDAILVPIVNGLTSFVAGLVVFSIIGFVSYTTGRSVNEFVSSGPGLAFVTYPQALGMMPGSHFWSICFFLMMFTLGIDTCIVQVQTVQTSLCDYFDVFKGRRELVSLGVCLSIFAASLLICTQGGMVWLEVIDRSVSYIILLIGLGEIIIFSYVYGVSRVCRDIETMLNGRLSCYWWFCWFFVCPPVLVILNITSLDQPSLDRPPILIFVSALIYCCALLVVPGYAIYFLSFRASGTFGKRCEESFNPTKEWGPKRPEDRVKWRHQIQRYANIFPLDYPNPAKLLPVTEHLPSEGVWLEVMPPTFAPTI